jgi:UDP-3-O-[3-hydroxymyristoyl] N-acetylglucosamine deacetylase
MALLGRLVPHNGYLDIEIDFDTPLIGRQRLGLNVAQHVPGEISAHVLSACYTTWSALEAGLALGPPHNTVAMATPDHEPRLRYPQGSSGISCSMPLVILSRRPPVLGSYRSVRGGHRLNAHVLKVLLADPTADDGPGAGARAVGVSHLSDRFGGRRVDPLPSCHVARIPALLTTSVLLSPQFG